MKKAHHGGKRPGAGKPPGVKWPSTLERETQRQAYREAVWRRLEPIVRSQVEKAEGRFARIAVVELTDAGLKLRRVSDETELMALVDAGTGYRISLADPDNDMSKYVTDQALGKPEGASHQTTVTTEGGKTIVKHEHLG